MASSSLGPLVPQSPSSPAGAGPIAPHHYHPPTPRELRAQAAHRLQIGVLGLASMLLLVGLANIIMDRARAGQDPAAVPTAATASAMPGDPANGGRDPLADIGVVPDLPTGKEAVSAPASGSLEAGTTAR